MRVSKGNAFAVFFTWAACCPNTLSCPAAPAYTFLCPVLGSPVQDRQGTTAESAIEGHKSGEGPGESPIWWKRLRNLGLFSLEKTEWGLYRCLEISKGYPVDGARLSSVEVSERTKGSGHKLERRKFHKNMRKALLWGWQSTGTGCPERLWSLLLYSRPVWTLSCVTYCKELLQEGVGLDVQGPFQPL